MLNDLEKKGYVIQWTEMFTEVHEEKQWQRMLIFCRTLPGRTGRKGR